MGLEVYLNPPGQVPGVGPEKLSSSTKHGVARFVSAHGSVRYVVYERGEPVAALQVVRLDKSGRPTTKGWHAAIIANVYTAPTHRREGWASTLLDAARRDFKVVEHAKEEMLSDDAQAWRKGRGR